MKDKTAKKFNLTFFLFFLFGYVSLLHTHKKIKGFVVHRGRAIPTLASMQEPLVPARLRQSKEKSNNDTKADERGKQTPQYILFLF